MRAEGTQGYGENAEVLFARYEAIRFENVQREVLHLFPLPPARALDVGAGTGRDAAALSRIGHRVVAVEPAPELRIAGERLHSGLGVIWVDDALPELARVATPEGGFDLILLTAVWMHLDASARETAMARLAELLAASGLMTIALRMVPSLPGDECSR